LWRPENRKPYIRTREIAKSETRKGEKVSDRSQPFAERFGFRHFGSCEDKRSGFLVPEFPKSRNVIQLCRRTRPSISGISTFRVSEGGKVKNLDNRIREIMKSETPKRRKTRYRSRTWSEISAYRHFGFRQVEESRSSTLGIVKPQNEVLCGLNEGVG
jgi:hypothetical protein